MGGRRDPPRNLRIVSLACQRHTDPALFSCGDIVTQHINKASTRSWRKQLGQGMTEYIIVVALVAIAAIAVYQLFGQVIRSQTAAMAKELAGEDGSEQSRAAQAAAESAAAQTASKTLKSFTGNAGAQ